MDGSWVSGASVAADRTEADRPATIRPPHGGTVRTDEDAGGHVCLSTYVTSIVNGVGRRLPVGDR